jgi:S1-C subfamily serine protease
VRKRKSRFLNAGYKIFRVFLKKEGYMKLIKYGWVIAVAILIVSPFCYAQDDDDDKAPGYLGIAPAELDDDTKEDLEYKGENGVLIQQVMPGTPAEEAELQEEDIIIAVDKEEMDSVETLRTTIADKGADTEVTLKIWRDKKEIEVKVKLAERPGGPQMPMPMPQPGDDEEEEEK